MIHIPPRLPGEVIIEEGLHPNPGPHRREPPDSKRRKSIEAGEEEQPKVKETVDTADDGCTFGFTSQGNF